MPLQQSFVLRAPGLGPVLGSTLISISDYSTSLVTTSITIFITEINTKATANIFAPSYSGARHQ
jgi:hypothetical protein